MAYDICPCNMALNALAGRLGLEYDPDGSNASSGHLCDAMLFKMNALSYYSQQPPKSLGKEWYVGEFRPIIEASDMPVADLLCTVTHHIAGQIARVLVGQGIGTLLVTGGGAFNGYLIDCLREMAPQTQINVPDALTVNYKEAIIFALLGYLRIIGKTNTLSSVTGAKCDSIGGVLSGIIPGV